MTSQLTFDEALSELAAERGMSVALSRLLDWPQRAEAYLEQLGPGSTFTADDLVEALGLPTGEDGTPNNNGVGATLSALAKRRLIRRVGYTNSRRVSNHSRVLRLWAVLP